MAITAGEQQSGGEVRDTDGRLIVTGPGGVPVGGGGGGTDPLSDGTPGGTLPAKTLWIAGANGAVLQGLVADATGRLRTVVEGTPAVSVSNFPGTQPVSLAAAVDVSDRAARLLGHVTVDTAPTTAVTGPLTDTQLRASAVPTSLASLPALTAGAAVIGKVDINSAPQVAVNNVETLVDNAGFTDGTSKLFPQGYIFDEVAGTALTENDVAAGRINANRAVVTVTEDGTTRGRYATVKAASTAAAATDPAQVVSLSPNSPVAPPTLTKGTQGATGFSTQDLIDAGRVVIAWTVSAFVTTAAAEGLLTVTESRDGAATSTFTTKVITSGKRLRIQSLMLTGGMAGTTPAIARVRARIRVNTAGAVTTASPLQHIASVSVAATARAESSAVVEFPDGFEFAGNGTVQIGVTVESPDWVTTTVTPYMNLAIVAFEY